LIIGVVSCHRACDHRRAARYRNSVTKAVVNSIVLIVIFDYILTRIPLK
jgi:ABC-type transporter Mla maintaining outer membrane lipid asymmetry permease subunit MlaE